MCGIVGRYNYQSTESVSKELLKTMNDAIIHRGPNDEGYYFKDNFGFAMRRLSIIDVEGGHQPIHNEDKTVWTVFNGEIYNFQVLRRQLKSKGHRFYTNTDTEVIVHLYEEYGNHFFNHLKGMFAIALWDENQKKLLLARDHIGIKPLYYYTNNSEIVFGSEIKTILQCKPNQTLDFKALNHYLSFLYIPTPYSIYQGIKKLSPGHFLQISEQGIVQEKYWSIEYNINTKISENDALDNLDDLLRKSVKRHLISDVPLGAFLSGGIDSSLVVSYMKQLMNQPVKTFTIGFKEKSFDETPQARLVAKALGTEHNELIIEPELEELAKGLISYFDEPYADYSSIAFYMVSQLARKQVTVAISGDGGDELFGGYQTYLTPDVQKIYHFFPKFLRDNVVKKMVHKLPTSFGRISLDFMAKKFVNGADLPYDEAHYYWKAIFTLEEKLKLFKPDCYDLLHSNDSVKIYKDLFKEYPTLDVKNKLMHIDLFTFLTDDNLTKGDRMSMANSLEVRVPLCDKDLLEFAATIPGNLKTKGLKTKYLLRKLSERYLPNEIVNGKKKGFSPPLAYWLKNELKLFMQKVLSEEHIKSIGFLNYSYIYQLINEHLTQKKDHNRKLWALMMFVVWWRYYYQKQYKNHVLFNRT